MKLIKNLSIILAIFILITCAGIIFAAEYDGSGSFLSGDSSSDGDGIFESDDDSGSLNSDVSDDDSDEEVNVDSDQDGSFNVKLSKHATGNPVLILLLALMSTVVLWFKDWNLRIFNF